MSVISQTRLPRHPFQLQKAQLQKISQDPPGGCEGTLNTVTTKHCHPQEPQKRNKMWFVQVDLTVFSYCLLILTDCAPKTRWKINLFPLPHTSEHLVHHLHPEGQLSPQKPALWATDLNTQHLDCTTVVGLCFWSFLNPYKKAVQHKPGKDSMHICTPTPPG